MINNRRLLPRRLGRKRDDGSLPVAVLLTVVGTSLSAVLMTSFLSQVTASTGGQDRLRALHARSSRRPRDDPPRRRAWAPSW